MGEDQPLGTSMEERRGPTDHSLTGLQDQKEKQTKLGIKERFSSEESPLMGKGVMTLALQKGTTILVHGIKTDY